MRPPPAARMIKMRTMTVYTNSQAERVKPPCCCWQGGLAQAGQPSARASWGARAYLGEAHGSGHLALHVHLELPSGQTKWSNKVVK
jgi:hypothetical protein